MLSIVPVDIFIAPPRAATFVLSALLFWNKDLLVEVPIEPIVPYSL